jgi:hypothetical protein
VPPEHDPHRAEQQLVFRRAVDLGEAPERELQPDEIVHATQWRNRQLA